MLNFLRSHAKSWFVSVMIGAIVVVFVLFGIGTFRSAQFQKVAEVDGVKIFLPEYLRAYQILMRSYQERLGGEFNEETLKALNLQAQTLNQLIDEVILQQAAQRLGLVVTDAELRQSIQRNPAFADERGFNEKRYYQMLARQRIPASDYEAKERQRLLLQKVVAFITGFAKVSEGDLKESHRLENEAVRVEYVVVGPARFLKEQQVSPEEIEAYYNTHQEQFREPEKFRARYLLLKFRDLEAKIKPDLKKMEAFFYDHLDEFSEPQAIRATELFLEIPTQASPAERQKLRQQAEALLKGAKFGVSFDQLLKKANQIQGLKVKTEDLGVVKRGQKPPAWEGAAFNLKKGEVGLAAAPNGFHIIQLIDVVENKAPTFAAVQARVEQAWREAEAVNLAQRQATDLRSEMVKSSFEATAKQHQFQIQETPLLAAQEAIPGLGLQPAVSQAALGLKPQELSKPIALPEGIVLLQVMERRESLLPPLAQIKERVGEAARLEKAKQTAAQKAKEVLVRLHRGESLAKQAAQMGLTIQDSGFFTRPQGFPGQPQASALITAAFALEPNRPFPNEPLALKGDQFILAFKERRQPTPEEFAKAKAQMEQNILELKRQMVFSQWLAEERRRAKIKVYELPS